MLVAPAARRRSPASHSATKARGVPAALTIAVSTLGIVPTLLPG